MSSARDVALGGGNPRIGLFFRLGITMSDGESFRMWLGIGDCLAGIDTEDGDGAIYKGMGEITNVPAFTQMINGTAERVTFQLSAVPRRAVELASGEAGDVKGAALSVGLGVFDAEWQLIEQPIWLRRFIVDYMTLQRQQSTAEPVYTISLSARSVFTGRRRPGLTYFTDEEQQRRSPGDRFCEHARRYSEDAKAWPRGG
jgi:hypothetical protein